MLDMLCMPTTGHFRYVYTLFLLGYIAKAVFEPLFDVYDTMKVCSKQLRICEEYQNRDCGRVSCTNRAVFAEEIVYNWIITQIMYKIYW